MVFDNIISTVRCSKRTRLRLLSRIQLIWSNPELSNTSQEFLSLLKLTVSGVSEGYRRQFSRRFSRQLNRQLSRQLALLFYRLSAEGAKNGVVDEQTPDD